MRPIKFRGMDENGKWHYGQYFNITKQGGFVGVGHYILPENSVFGYKVRPETIEQFIDGYDNDGGFETLTEEEGAELYEALIGNREEDDKTRQQTDWEELADECKKLNVTKEDIEAAREVTRQVQNEIGGGQ